MRVAAPGGAVFQSHRGVAPGPGCGCVGRSGGATGPAGGGMRAASPRLEREKRELEHELAKACFVVEVQAKLHALLETISESEAPEPESTP